jgi:hypothetical protein
MRYKTKPIWIAIRSQRGFITDAAVFETENAAALRERRWRKTANVDYDETAIFQRKVRLRPAPAMRQAEP